MKPGGGVQRRLDYSALIERELARWDVWPAGDGRWRSCCPVHKGDNNTAFSIFQNGRWRCHKCDAHGDMPRLLVVTRRITLAQAREICEEAPGRWLDMSGIPELPLWKDRHKVGAVPYPILPESTLGPFRRNCPRYLINRQFSAEILQKYEIGYDLQNSKIVIPVRDVKKRLVGLTYRVDYEGDTTQRAKYWHDNFLKAHHLYGFYHWADVPIDQLWLTEGQLDTVRLAQLDIASCAVMGSTISKDQVDVLLRHCRAERLVLAFDNDEAGAKATHASVKAFSRTRFGRTLAVACFPGKDPGELTESYVPHIEPWYSATLSLMQ